MPQPDPDAEGTIAPDSRDPTNQGSLPAWMDQAIVYAIDVPAFRDGNGDGIGDLGGVIDALDDLLDLGVTAIWLLPFYPSPRQDNGYDVANHLDVDERLGTLDDFRRLVSEAHGRDMRVIIDLVANHTSDQHPWFREAIDDPDSQYHDYYVWTGNPGNEPPMEPVFPGFEESVWHHVPAVNAWYLHHFYRFEPDLNTGLPPVREVLREIVTFWLELGVDGFRIDAAPFLGDDLIPGTPDPHGILKDLRWWLGEVNPEACFVAEADLPAAELAPYFGNDDEMHGLFDFLLNRRTFLALAQESAAPLVQSLTECPPTRPGEGWVSFLRHLDELSLSFLDDDERQQVFERFAPLPAMRVYNRGIRRRLAPLLENDLCLMRLVFSLQFSLPATPMIAYGDEIGLQENLVLPERAAVRTAMQWDAPGATPTVMLLPAIVERNAVPIPVEPSPLPEGAAAFRACVRDLVRLRQQELRHCRRSFALLDSGNDAVLAHSYEPGSGTIRCVHNLSPHPQEVDLPGIGAGALVLLSSEDNPAPAGQSICLEGYGFRWLRSEEGEDAR